MLSPRLGPREIVYEDNYQQIYAVTADFGDFKKEYFVRDTGERTGVVVVQDESVLLVRQYRLLIDGLSWEIPGGRVDDGETAEEAAVRECQEETGLTCRELRPLITFHPGLDITDNLTHVYFADQFEQDSGAEKDIREVQEQVWTPVERCMEMVSTGQIVDSLSIIGLLSYRALSPG